jgi:hypothetical protein
MQGDRIKTLTYLGIAYLPLGTVSVRGHGFVLWEAGNRYCIQSFAVTTNYPTSRFTV